MVVRVGGSDRSGVSPLGREEGLRGGDAKASGIGRRMLSGALARGRAGSAVATSGSSSPVSVAAVRKPFSKKEKEVIQDLGSVIGSRTLRWHLPRTELLEFLIEAIETNNPKGVREAFERAGFNWSEAKKGEAFLFALGVKV